jgi:hypothetical protein
VAGAIGSEYNKEDDRDYILIASKALVRENADGRRS